MAQSESVSEGPMTWEELCLTDEHFFRDIAALMKMEAGFYSWCQLRQMPYDTMLVGMKYMRPIYAKQAVVTRAHGNYRDAIPLPPPPSLSKALDKAVVR